MDKIFSRGIYFFTLIASFFFFIWHQYFSYIFYLSNADDTIYAQALQLITWDNLNPFIPVRQVHIFNDHFDLVLIPFALTFAKIFPPLAVGYFLEVFFLFLACLVLFYMYKKGDISFSVLTLATMVLVLSEGTVMAIGFPMHSTTWSVFPIVLLGYFVYKENRKGIVLSLLFLFLFKEIFVFCGLMLALYYLWKRDYKLFAWLFFLSVFWYILAFHLRYSFLPHESVRYDEQSLSNLTFNGLKSMVYVFFHGHKSIKHNTYLLLPLFAIFAYVFYKRLSLNLLPLLLVFPLYAINVSMASDVFWDMHRLIYFVVFITLFIAFTFGKKEVSKVLLLGLLLFFLYVDHEDFNRWLFSRQKFIQHLTWKEKWERKKAIDEGRVYLSQFRSANIFTYVNIAGRLTKNYPVFFASGQDFMEGKGKERPTGYNEEAENDFLFLEKEPNGDPYDKDFEYMNDLRKKWVSEGAEVVIDDSYILVLQKSGSF